MDLGEGGSADAELIALVSSANIACGGHAGDEGTMRAAVGNCLAHGVAIGAHPGHEDRVHFGRRALEITPDQLRGLVSRQLEQICTIASGAGATVQHVKPHGALYHQCDRDPGLAAALVRVVAETLPGCRIYGPAGGALAAAADEAGLRMRVEGFADRRYASDGGLVPRGEPGAVIGEISAVAEQALWIAREQRVRAICGAWLGLPARTLCLHGDHPGALHALRAVRQALEGGGFAIRAD